MFAAAVDELGVSLSKIRILAILQIAGRTKDEARDRNLVASPGEALLLWLADWLHKRQPIGEEQQNLLLSDLAERIIFEASAIEHEIDKGLELSLKTIQLMIVDNTLVSMSGLTDFLDLRSGCKIAGPTQMPIETISVNLTALYCFHRQRLVKDKKCQTEPTS